FTSAAHALKGDLAADVAILGQPNLAHAAFGMEFLHQVSAGPSRGRVPRKGARGGRPGLVMIAHAGLYRLIRGPGRAAWNEGAGGIANGRSTKDEIARSAVGRRLWDKSAGGITRVRSFGHERRGRIIDRTLRPKVGRVIGCEFLGRIFRLE